MVNLPANFHPLFPERLTIAAISGSDCTTLGVNGRYRVVPILSVRSSISGGNWRPPRSQTSLSSAATVFVDFEADEIPLPASLTNCTATGASANAAIKHPLVVVTKNAKPQNRAILGTSDPG